MHSKHDPNETTKAARAAGPTSIAWHERAVDPDGVLEPAERLRRAQHHRKEHFARLAFLASKARRGALAPTPAEKARQREKAARTLLQLGLIKAERFQTDLARATGRHPKYVNRVCLGQAEPDAEFRRAAAEFLGLPEAELFDVADESEQAS
jgi:transcriptional regulator with XRE-family HTH domain